MKNISILHPVAFMPLAMSIAALGLLLLHVAVYGVVRDPDEGAAAHLFQLLMAGQIPLVAYILVRWLPVAPRQTLQVFAIQATGAIAAIAAVYFLT